MVACAQDNLSGAEVRSDSSGVKRCIPNVSPSPSVLEMPQDKHGRNSVNASGVCYYPEPNTAGILPKANTKFVGYEDFGFMPYPLPPILLLPTLTRSVGLHGKGPKVYPVDSCGIFGCHTR